MEQCPETLLKINKAMICFRIKSLTLSANDTVSVLLNRSSPAGNPTLTIYPEFFWLEKKLARTENPFVPIVVPPGNSRATVLVAKKKLLIGDSLIPGRDPEKSVLLEYAQPMLNVMAPAGTSYYLDWIFDPEPLISQSAVARLSFPEVLASFISSIQLLTGVIGLFLIVVNSLYLKVELAKRLYEN